jgi:hypothetical protein
VYFANGQTDRILVPFGKAHKLNDGKTTNFRSKVGKANFTMKREKIIN